MAAIGERSTGSATIAGLLLRAADRHADLPAVRRKRGGDWVDVSFAEVGTISEIARGLIDLGLGPGDRVAPAVNSRYAQVEQIKRFASSTTTSPRRPAS